MHLFLGSLFCSIDLYVWFFASTMLSDYSGLIAIVYSLILGSVLPSNLFFFLKIAIQGLFWVHINFWNIYSSSVKFVTLFIKKILFIFRERGREKAGGVGGETSMCERNIHWLPLAYPQLETWPTTQACALTSNWTGDVSVCRPTPNPLNHTSQGCYPLIK